MAAALLLLAGLGAALPACGAAPPLPRAVWVWESLPPVDPSAWLDTFQRNRITTVFLFAAPRDLRLAPQRFAAFLAAAHAAGLAVHAVDGEAYWVQPDSRPAVADFFAAVAAYHAGVAPNQRFDAIHLDVEPYTLDDWGPPASSPLPRRYVELLRYSRRAAAQLGLPLAVDVPMFFQYPVVDGRSLLAHALGEADEVAIMSYERGGDHALERSRKLLEGRDSGSAKLWIGISADPSHTRQSSRAAGRRHLEASCAAIEAEARAHPRLRGAAIHDLDDLLALQEPGAAGAASTAQAP